MKERLQTRTRTHIFLEDEDIEPIFNYSLDCVVSNIYIPLPFGAEKYQYLVQCQPCT